MMGQRQQQVFLMPLLVGTDGVQKMSKSLGNYIAVDEPPNDMYGKVMSIKDPLIMPYFELLTDVSDQDLVEMKLQLDSQSVNPMALKKRLAADIVTQFHGLNAACLAEEHFASVRQRKEVPKELQATVKIGLKVNAVVVVQRDVSRRIVEAGLAESVSEAQRLIAQRAVEIDGQKLTLPQAELKDGSIIKVGNRGFIKIIDANKMTWEVAKA
jgi:tyrosyl-tRNA synthetase